MMVATIKNGTARGAQRRAKGGARTTLPVGKRSEGAYQIARLGLTQVDIATKLKVETSTVSRWIAGEVRPVERMRLLIAERFAISPETWDVPHAMPKPAAPVAKGSSPRLTPTGAGEMLRDLLTEQIYKIKNREEECADLTPKERAELLGQCTKLYIQIQTTLDEREQLAALVRLKAWHLLKSSLVNALRPFPDACASVARVLSEAETEE